MWGATVESVEFIRLYSFESGLFDFGILFMLSSSCSCCSECDIYFFLTECFNWIYCKYCCISMPYMSISCWYVSKV